MEHWSVSVLLILPGIGMAGIWTRDILTGKFSGQGPIFQWREGENMLWPHILAEYLTSLGLMAGGIGLWLYRAWSVPVSLISLGGLIYSAINSSGWVFARKERLPYGIPMWVSLALAIVLIILLYL